MVFLDRAHLGGTEKALYRSGGFRLENCADGRLWSARIAGTNGLVLPAQRAHDAIAFHAELELARTGFLRIRRAELRG